MSIGLFGTHEEGCARLARLLGAMGVTDLLVHAPGCAPSSPPELCLWLRAAPEQERAALGREADWAAWERAQTSLARSLAGAPVLQLALRELLDEPAGRAARLRAQLQARGIATKGPPTDEFLAGLESAGGSLSADSADSADTEAQQQELARERARAERAERELHVLEREAAQERRELARFAERAEADLARILWSRRYRLANLLAQLAHRLLPRFAWTLVARGLRLAHPWMVRLGVRALQPEPPASLAELSTRIAGASTPLPQQELELASSLRAGVTVVVTVHDAPEATRACLASLERHLQAPFELLIVDDASREASTRELLAAYAQRPRTRLVRNEENLGYTASVNLALERCAGDVLLLNSDTQVGPRFLEQLALAAHAGPRVASVTAVSDNAGAFSVPEAERENPWPAGFSAEELARQWLQSGADFDPDVPTGSGFCLYLRREALAQVGPFDTQAFPRGYGEENDWCLRAAALGWSHRASGRVLVTHARSASFGAERAGLAAAGRTVVDERHPGYAERLRAFQHSPAMARLRETARAARERPRPRLRVLYLLYDSTGGTPHSTRDLMNAIEPTHESFLLLSDGQELKLSRLEQGQLVLCERTRLAEALTVARSSDPAYRAFLSQCLQRHAIELVHVRHLAGHGLDAPELVAGLMLPLVLSFHDFYLACPTAHLLDEKDRYCAGECTPGDGRCRVPTRWSAKLPHLKHAWIHEWRRQVRQRVLRHCDAFVTTTQSSRAVLEGVHPELMRARFAVIPHGRDLVQHDLAREPVPGQPLRVLVLGELTPAKGGALIQAIAAADKGAQVEWHFLGKVNREFGGIGTEHGAYARDELVERVAAIGPHVIGLFTIWAETWSHTLTEAWSLGIPVVATRLGAFAERLAEHGGGWLIEPTDPAACLARLRQIASAPAEWRAERARATLAGHSDLSGMAKSYLALYEELRAARRALSSGD